MSLLEELFMTIEESEKKDPKAKVRNRPNPVFDATSSLVNDDKDHFPLGSIKQGRNALARANGYKRKPTWFTGTLEELKKKVASAVKREYPSIEVTEKATD
jgi:hypothetical protein